MTFYWIVTLQFLFYFIDTCLYLYWYCLHNIAYNEQFKLINEIQNSTLTLYSISANFSTVISKHLLSLMVDISLTLCIQFFHDSAPNTYWLIFQPVHTKFNFIWLGGWKQVLMLSAKPARHRWNVRIHVFDLAAAHIGYFWSGWYFNH